MTGPVVVSLSGHLVTADGTCTRPQCRGRQHPYVVPTDPTTEEDSA